MAYLRKLYSTVTRVMWNDTKFLTLSAAPPNAQTLWLYLLTSPMQGPIPGLFSAGVGGIADGLGWPPSAVAGCLEEVQAQGLLHISTRPPLVWLPNAVQHNPPASPNVVRHWRKAYVELPECDLREQAMMAIGEGLEASFREAFTESFGGLLKPLDKPSLKTCPIQEQEQEQEEHTVALELARLLLASIRTHSKAHADNRVKPRHLTTWAADIDKLLRIDKADPAEVRAVIEWAHQKEPRGFWRGNLLSGRKVRQHWTQLRLQATSGGALSPTRNNGQGWEPAALMRLHDRAKGQGQRLTARHVMSAMGLDAKVAAQAIGWLEERT